MRRTLMTLKIVDESTGLKVKGLSVTYRAGPEDRYSTCPDTCALKPNPTNTNEIDREYEYAVRNTVPKYGTSYLYTHFHPDNWSERNQEGKAIFNYSCDKLDESVGMLKQGIPTTVVVKEDFWEGQKSKKVDNIVIARCVNEVRKDISCKECRMCVKVARKFVVGFSAHGTRKKLAGQPEEKGGCYGEGGNVGLHWRRMEKQPLQEKSDAEKYNCLLYTSPSPRDKRQSRMPSSA